MKKKTNSLSSDEQKALLKMLQKRFSQFPERHRGITWEQVEERLKSNPSAMSSIQRMEDTGGEPDVVAFDPPTKTILFYDCSAESPKGRRSVCYDRAGWESRKEHQPENTAMDMAEEMGVTVLDESEYRFLQQLGEFDLKTSSWLATPASIRKLGGALFGDRRYDHVFVYHNGAQSYYAARGFRAKIRI